MSSLPPNFVGDIYQERVILDGLDSAETLQFRIREFEAAMNFLLNGMKQGQNFQDIHKFMHLLPRTNEYREALS